MRELKRAVDGSHTFYCNLPTLTPLSHSWILKQSGEMAGGRRARAVVSASR